METDSEQGGESNRLWKEMDRRICQKTKKRQSKCKRTQKALCARIRAGLKSLRILRD